MLNILHSIWRRVRVLDELYVTDLIIVFLHPTLMIFPLCIRPCARDTACSLTLWRSLFHKPCTHIFSTKQTPFPSLQVPQETCQLPTNSALWSSSESCRSFLFEQPSKLSHLYFQFAPDFSLCALITLSYNYLFILCLSLRVPRGWGSSIYLTRASNNLFITVGQRSHVLLSPRIQSIRPYC